MKFGFVFFLTLIFLSAGQAADTKQNIPVVLVKQAKASELFDLLSYPARIVPKINATVFAESDGVVSKIATPLGKTVNRHQTMMIITHTDPVYQFAPVTVVAPVSGVISSVDITEGSQVTKGLKLATVTDPDKIQI